MRPIGILSLIAAAVLSAQAHAADYPEAIAYRKPVSLYKPRSVAAKAVRALADETAARLVGLVHGAPRTEAA